MGEEKREATKIEVQKLLSAGFITEAKYTTWLANVVLVKKPNGKWRMCTDYIDLNKACPKDTYPLPSIDRLVDGAAGHRVLSFLDAYSGYNQIPMYAGDKEKTAFITEEANFYYEVMPFGLKNAGATYQRLMDRVFHHLIGKCMEVYVDDMVVMSDSLEQHIIDLKEVLHAVRRYDMRLNPEKCVFGVTGGKFLGFMLTHRGIEANPDKCQAVLSMRSPANIKETQRLVGRLAALSRFMPTLAEKTQPMLKLMKKACKFAWDEACEHAFVKLKEYLSSPPILHKPAKGKPLLIYLAISNNVVSTAIVQEHDGQQQPVYFISRVLHDAELRYQTVEKVALALVVTTRRLRPYFQSYEAIVRTDYPIHKMLRRPDLAGRMVGWSVELSEFHIRCEARGAIKAQCLADFVNELAGQTEPNDNTWTLFVDGSSNTKGGGAGIVLQGPNNLLLEQSLRFGFKPSNNQAEYEALIAGLHLAADMGVENLTCKSDSQLLVGHMDGSFQVKDPLLIRYYHVVKGMLAQFKTVRLEHINRAQNSRADLLSKLATTKIKGQHHTVIHATLSQPTVTMIDSNVTEVTKTEDKGWMVPIVQFIQHGEDSGTDDPTIRKKASRFMLIGGELYKRGFSNPLLKCVAENQTQYLMDELHTGICGFHSGSRTMASRILRAGYYWPTLKTDCDRYVQRCTRCQQHGNLLHAKPEELHTIMSPWPFAMWGMDILGPFSPGRGQVKFLLVAVDYFTKWIEVEPLATITAQQVQKFVWHNLICRFGVPKTIITDNGRQFIDKGLADFYKGLHIHHVTSSVEHPQTNGQAEAANKVILKELKKRLGEAKGTWADELLEVLWAYRCTPQSTTKETPYSLTYGVDAMIPIEIGDTSLRRRLFDVNLNNESMLINLDLL